MSFGRSSIETWPTPPVGMRLPVLLWSAMIGCARIEELAEELGEFRRGVVAELPAADPVGGEIAVRIDAVLIALAAGLHRDQRAAVAS